MGKIENAVNAFLGKTTNKKKKKVMLISDKSIQTEQIEKIFITEDGRKLLND